MSETLTAEATAALRLEVEALLFREAAFLDRRDFEGWIGLYTDDAIYWIPSMADDVDPARQVSIVYDDYGRLRERVWRLDSGLAYAQEPFSRTLHLVGNVDVVHAAGDELHVESALVVTEFRRDRQFLHSARCRHELRREGGELRITLKKIELINNDGHLGNLSLLL
jgi:3-phenylpropionate/cinnamic acid dioxygenase small subunit